MSAALGAVMAAIMVAGAAFADIDRHELAAQLRAVIDDLVGEAR